MRVHYDFGRGAGVKTKISLRSSDGSFLDKIHSFVIDPLPEYMSFDLTVFGEGSFLYESDRSYSVTYSMESIQNQFLVELQLVDLPERIEANWGLDINLGLKSASGFVDLDMSDNLGEVALYFNNSEKPFMRVTDFPKKLCLNGFIDSNLRGCISASKYSGSPTVLSVTFAFGRWEITGALTLKDGYLSVLWNLPSSGSTHAMVGLDTNDNAMIGANIVVEDTEENIDLLYVGFDAVATDDLLFSWDVDVFGNISNFRLNGRITKLLDLHVSVYYRGGYFDVTGSWVLGESGSFLIQFNKEVDFTFANITSDQFKLYGYLSLYADRKIKIEWEWGETGYFTVYTFGKSVGKKLQLEFGYGPKQEDIYRYGFNFAATEFLNATRTVQWDTENGVIPRIWILGDQPLPEGWAAKLLWNYEWYEVI
ncbi:MAG TPA: hypothetical protein EYP23_06450 [Thermoplasmata archaeon]|nr:hypothetical protein [Thermoplasmata archaeon]